jgi:aromatic ring-opening dioxygenase LigB subunit
MLTFAAIVPHSPLLLPSIGREHLARLHKTTEALAKLETALLESKPDAIVIISPHGAVAADHFTLDLNEHYACNLKEFGVFDHTLACRADLGLMHEIKNAVDAAGLPLRLRSQEGLDYGTVVPLSCLAGKLGPFAVVPISPALLPLKTHFEFGRALQEALVGSHRRIAVLASAELSHRLTNDAPGGYEPRAQGFDEKIVQLLENNNVSGLLNLDPELVLAAGECGLSTLVTYAGILDKISTRPEILSYEAPFGVGTLVARHHFN